MTEAKARHRGLAGLLAALFWVLLCVRWFDVAATWRPPAIALLPPLLLAVAAAAATGLWLKAAWPDVREAWPTPHRELLWVVGLVVLFRLPTAWGAAAGAVTPDGALSGIVAVHVRDGVDHHVFVPHVPYSGSLKSHLAAPLAALVDAPRAFALASLGFYALFVAAVFHLGAAVGGKAVGLLAGLYLAFSPAYVTRYSLSNDGNYVEVLALGSWALVLAVPWIEAPRARPTLAVLAGLLLGLGFWCHILAVIHVAAFGLVLLLAAPRAALGSAVPAAVGWALGYVPGLLWNAANHWGSFRYLLPGQGGEAAEATGASWGSRLLGFITDQLPSLLGYDPGYPPLADTLLRAAAFVAVALVCAAVGRALRDQRSRPVAARFVLLVFGAVNVVVALLALPQLPGNPRYLLFLMAPIAVFLADAARGTWSRVAFGALVLLGAGASLAQWPGVMAGEEKWRDFVGELRAEGVRYCYTDFYLATKVNFLSEEGVVCSAKLGPTTTEYFFEYRERVEKASSAALIAVNQTAARRMEGRLQELGVSYERRDLMKPTLLRLSRKVEPEELFPGRAFPWR